MLLYYSLIYYALIAGAPTPTIHLRHLPAALSQRSRPTTRPKLRLPWKFSFKDKDASMEYRVYGI